MLEVVIIGGHLAFGPNAHIYNCHTFQESDADIVIANDSDLWPFLQVILISHNQ